MIQANLAQINWTDEFTGAGVMLGSIDGYPALDHPELGGRVSVANLANAKFNPYSKYADHGTGVSGIAMGKNGVAPGARLTVVPIWTSSDRAVWYSWARTGFLDRAYAALARAGAVCVNRELNSERSGVPGGEAIWGWWNTFNPMSYATELDLVAKYPQMVHVQPAGNQGVAIANQPFLKSASTLDHLLIVVSVDGANRKAYDSNTPQSRSLYRAGKRDPVLPENLLKNFTVCAPGFGISMPASPSGSAMGYGTSFAAPHAQGLVAQMYQKAARVGVSLTPQRCASIIKQTCTPLGDPEVYGHGLINVKAALEAVI